MLRREFVGLGALAAAGAGCVKVPVDHAGAPLAAASMTETLAGIDALVRALRAWFRASLHPGSTADEVVLTRGLEDLWAAMAVYASFRDLPLRAQVHPGMQRRIRQAGDWFHDAAVGLLPLVKDPTSPLWDRLERGQHGVDAERAIGFAEERARALGVGPAGRRQLLRMMRAALDRSAQRTSRELAGEMAASIDATLAGNMRVETDAAVTAAAAEAHAEWVADGADDAAGADEDATGPDTFSKRHKLERRTAKGLQALGLTLVISGSILLVIGIWLMAAIVGCLCIGALVAIPGLVCLIAGIVNLTEAAALRAAEDARVESAEPVP